MNTATMPVTMEWAYRTITEIVNLPAAKRTGSDNMLLNFCRKAVRIGRYEDNVRVIELDKALFQAGVNDKDEPKLAIARADWENVAWNSSYREFQNADGSRRRKANRIEIPRTVYPNGTCHNQWKTLRTAVPHIPPHLRPSSSLSNYHVLFEVESWTEYNRDPFLLRHVHGFVYIVVAEWDLTPLEASLLGSMRGGS